MMIYIDANSSEALACIPVGLPTTKGDIVTIAEAVGGVTIATVEVADVVGEYAHVFIPAEVGVVPGEYSYTISDGEIIKAQGILRVFGDGVEYSENDGAIKYSEYE